MCPWWLVDMADSRACRDRIDAIIVPSAPTLSSGREWIARLASAAGISGAFSVREHVDAGGLISYGVSFRESYQGCENSRPGSNSWSI
jgi:hypothetical protein